MIDIYNKKAYVFNYDDIKSNDNIEIFIDLLKVINKKICVVVGNNDIDGKTIFKKFDYIYNTFYDVLNKLVNYTDFELDDIMFIDNNIDIYELIDIKLFVDNFGILLKLVRKNNLYSFIKYSISLNDNYVNDKIRNDLYYILNKVSRKDLVLLLEILKNDYYFNIKEYMDIIVEKVTISSSLQVFYYFMEDTNFMVDKMEMFLEIAYTKEQLKIVLNYYKNIDISNKKIEALCKRISNYPDFINHINIGTLLKMENTGTLDKILHIIKEYNNDLELTYVSNGIMSVVFKDNNYIYKIGKRHNYETKYSKYILNPYFRKKIDGIVLEIQDICKVSEDINDLILLQNNLKKENIFWLDSKLENIGILLKDNFIHNEDIGFFGYENHEKLEKGNIVIMDVDWIYTDYQLKKYHDDFDVISNKCLIQINVNDLEIIKKIFNQTFEDYCLIVNDKELLGYDSRITMIKDDNIPLVNLEDIDLDDYYSLGKVYEKSINDRIK